MKREHLEYLWEHYHDGCLGPPFQPFPEEVWQDLLTRGILDDGFQPEDVYPFDLNNKYGDIGRQCFCDDGIWQVSGFSSEELDALCLNGKIRIHQIEFETLARYTAKLWGIKPVYSDLVMDSFFIIAYLLGWKGRDTAVVLSPFFNNYDPLDGYLWDVKDLVDEEFQVIYGDGILEESSEENHEKASKDCPWTCDYIYVINIGASISRTASEQKVLDNDRIICLGTQDFLTEDGEPIWDARVKPRSVLVFNEAMKEWECDAEPLRLTPTESRIIKLLVQNSDRFTEPEELFKVAWPEKRKKRQGKRLRRPKFPEGPLYTLISLLRIKLESTGRLSIENTRGKGYKLIVH